MDYVREQIAETQIAVARCIADEHLISSVSRVGAICGAALEKGNKIMLAGNGGSAADSQHIAAEFVSRLCCDRRPLPALALTTDTSVLTAAGNDYGFETVFERQVLALGQRGDVLIAISTSGNSPNILRALKVARRKQITTVGLTGENGGLMRHDCDELLNVPTSRTPKIQELHIMFGHILCGIAEKSFLEKTKAVPSVVDTLAVP